MLLSAIIVLESLQVSQLDCYSGELGYSVVNFIIDGQDGRDLHAWLVHGHEIG